MLRQPRVNAFVKIVVVAITGITLAACGSAAVNSGGSSKANASPSASATTNPADLQALLAAANQTIPFYSTLNGCPGCPKSNVYSDCAWASGGWGYSQCPLSPRLRAYLVQHPYNITRGGAGGSPTHSMTADLTPTGGVVHVVLFDGLLKLDLIMVKVNGQYVLDDVTCTGVGSATSIYNPPPGSAPPSTVSAWGCGFTG